MSIKDLESIDHSFGIKFNKSKAKDILSLKLSELLNKLKLQVNLKNTQELLHFFELLEEFKQKQNVA